MPFVAAKVLSNPTRYAWAQVYDSSDPGQSALGHLIAAVSLTASEQSLPEEGITQIGRQLLLFLHEVYFKSGSADSPFERISAAVRQATEKFAPYSPDIAACVVWKDYIYLTTAGKGRILIVKDRQVMYLPTAGTVSGRAGQDGIFLLVTGGFLACINRETLAEAATGATPDEIADILSPVVHRKSQPTAAAAIIRPKVETVAQQEATVRVTDRFKEKLVWLAKRLPDRSVYVKAEARGRRTAASVGVILLVILLASIFFGLRQKSTRERRAIYEGRLVQAQTLYAESLNQKDVDPAGAREKFLQAKDIVQTILAEGTKDTEVDKLNNQLAEQETNILGKVEASVGVFLDLALVRSDVQASEIAQHKDKLVILDKNNQRLFLVSLAPKQTSTVGGAGKTPEPISASIYDGKAYVVTSKGIVEVIQTASSLVVDKDDWGDVFKIGMFGGNIYLLSRQNMIWRHPVTPAGFGSKQTWLAKDVQVDFATAVDWAIDGSIWVLFADDTIAKFTRGARENFRTSGVEGGLSKSAAIYTNDQLDSIFVLQRELGRIVQLSKDGKYKLQYISEDLKQTEDFVVSESAHKIFLLTKTKILEVLLR